MQRRPLVKKICRARVWDWCGKRCGKNILVGQFYYYVTSYEKYHLACLPEELKQNVY